MITNFNFGGKKIEDSIGIFQLKVFGEMLSTNTPTVIIMKQEERR